MLEPFFNRVAPWRLATLLNKRLRMRLRMSLLCSLNRKEIGIKFDLEVEPRTHPPLISKRFISKVPSTMQFDFHPLLSLLASILVQQPE